jgi:hypothetical protein
MYMDLSAEQGQIHVSELMPVQRRVGDSLPDVNWTVF